MDRNGQGDLLRHPDQNQRQAAIRLPPNISRLFAITLAASDENLFARTRDEKCNGQSSFLRHPDNGHYEPSPAGVGKSSLACALGHKTCREDFSVAYHRVPRLFAALALARGDGRYGRILKSLARTDLLILDDWGPEKLNNDPTPRSPRDH